jgi:hypothetical protein
LDPAIREHGWQTTRNDGLPHKAAQPQPKDTGDKIAGATKKENVGSKADAAD